MPRNSSGVYSLPAGNPVTSFTVITTAWANPTMSDIAAEITNSLDRNGRGGMLAPFRIFDGTISQPGLGFINEVGIGLWREATGLAHLVNTGQRIITIKPDRMVSPLIAELDGDGAYFKQMGFKSWRKANLAGVLSVNPSASVDGEDWAALGYTIDPTTGIVDFSGAPTVAGTPLPDAADLAVIQGEVDAVELALSTHAALVGDAAHGLGTISTQDADAVAITGGTAVSLAITSADRIAPATPPSITTAQPIDWAAVPTQVLAAPGNVVAGMNNMIPGEMKRIVVVGSGAITINTGGQLTTFTWATGSPAWGTTRTIVSLICVATGVVIGVTLPVA